MRAAVNMPHLKGKLLAKLIYCVITTEGPDERSMTQGFALWCSLNPCAPSEHDFCLDCSINVVLNETIV